MAKVDKYSIHGLKRRPTYEEIIGIIDESNEKITGKLPDRSATMFKNSQEGSYFDGSDSMEQLKEEQARLLLRQMSEVLLRQNIRTAGRTFHAEKSQQLPTQSPVISQPTQPMNVDEETTQQTTPTMPSSSTQQASQLNAELSDRGNKAMKRREETAINHRGEVFKQNKPTITEQIHHINPPRSFTPIKPETFNIATEDEGMTQAVPKPKPKPRSAGAQSALPKRKATVSASASSLDSLQIPIVDVMEVSSSSKRATPEIEGKAGRPNTKHQKPDTSRADGTKRDKGSEAEGTPAKKKRNRAAPSYRPSGGNNKKDLELAGAEADDEFDETKDNRRKTIQKPVGPSTIGIQRLREEFVNANNKGMITKEHYEQFDSLYKTWVASKGNDSKKKQLLKQMRETYKLHLFQKVKEAYKNQ